MQTCTFELTARSTLLGFRYFDTCRANGAWIFYGTKPFLSQPHISSFQRTTCTGKLYHTNKCFGYRQPKIHPMSKDGL